MVGGGGEALVWAVALTALVLLPLASWLIAGVGREISEEVRAGNPPVDVEAEFGRRGGRSRGG